MSIDPGATNVTTEFFLRIDGRLKRVATASATANPDQFRRLTLTPSRSIRRFLREVPTAHGELRVVYPGGATTELPLTLT